MSGLTNPAERWLVELWGSEQEKRELLWGITDESEREMQEWREECAARAAHEARAKAIDGTDTREELRLEPTAITPVPTARVLFPIWEAEAPLETAIKLATARAHLEAA
jgi:hypothetical protein